VTFIASVWYGVRIISEARDTAALFATSRIFFGVNVFESLGLIQNICNRPRRSPGASSKAPPGPRRRHPAERDLPPQVLVIAPFFISIAPGGAANRAFTLPFTYENPKLIQNCKIALPDKRPNGIAKLASCQTQNKLLSSCRS